MSSHPADRRYHAGVRTRRIESSTVTAIGGGDVCLATSAARGVPARDVEHALHHAIELGLTVFDVASDPDSERLAGEALRALRARDRVVIASRVTARSPVAGAPTRDVLSERLPVAYVQHAVEASLRATRLEVLPLVQLPLRAAWRSSSAWAELAGTCARLVREGKVLAWGALLDDPGEDGAAELVAEPWLAALSVVYQLCDRRAEPLFEAATKREMAVLARQPLAGGALTGVLGPGISLPPRDDRQSLDTAALTRIAVAVARLAPLVRRPPPAARSCDAAREAAELAHARVRADERGQRERADRGDPSAAADAAVACEDLAELALRFVIDRGCIALPRLHRREHVLAAIQAAAAPPLSAAVIAEVLRADPAH